MVGQAAAAAAGPGGTQVVNRMMQLVAVFCGSCPAIAVALYLYGVTELCWAIVLLLPAAAPSQIDGANPAAHAPDGVGEFAVLEFERIVAPLTTGTPPFHVVAPSLPGYGLSSAPTSAGWGVRATADAAHEVMRRVGYGRYCAHGGDWGALSARALPLLMQGLEEK